MIVTARRAEAKAKGPPQSHYMCLRHHLMTVGWPHRYSICPIGRVEHVNTVASKYLESGGGYGVSKAYPYVVLRTCCIYLSYRFVYVGRAKELLGKDHLTQQQLGPVGANSPDSPQWSETDSLISSGPQPSPLLGDYASSRAPYAHHGLNQIPETSSADGRQASILSGSHVTLDRQNLRSAVVAKTVPSTTEAAPRQGRVTKIGQR